MKKHKNGYYIFNIMCFIITFFIIIAVFIYISEPIYKIVVLPYAFIHIIVFLHFVSSRLLIIQDISQNDLLVFKSIFGANSIYVNRISKIIFIKRKNFISRNLVCIYDHMNQSFIIPGYNRAYQRTLEEIIDRVKGNKDTIIDNDLLEFLQISDIGVSQTQNENENNNIIRIKEEMRKDKNFHQDSLSMNLINLVMMALFSIPVLLFAIRIILIIKDIRLN